MLVNKALRQAVGLNVGLYDPKLIGFSALGVRIGGVYANLPQSENTAYKTSVAQEDLAKVLTKQDFDTFILDPGMKIVLYTQEYFSMDWYSAAMFTFKSVTAQLWLEQSSSVWALPGWNGHLILKLTNTGPESLVLRKGDVIGQMSFFRCEDCEDCGD